MDRTVGKVIAGIVAAAALAGCAGPRTYQEDAAARGAVVGAGTGALIGGLAGRSPGAAVTGGILGGLFGASVGAASAAPPPRVYARPRYDDDDCFVRTPSGRARPVPCDD